MNTNEKYIKLSLWTSITVDISLVIAFVIGFTLGLCSVQFGFFLVGFIFRFGVYFVATSIILKIITIVLCIPLDTTNKRGYFAMAVSASIYLLMICAVVYGIYYIGKVMTAVG